MSRLKSSRDLGFLSKIGTIPPHSGRLDTLQGFLGGPGGTCSSGKKNQNLRSSNSWKCIEIVNPTITTLFLYHFLKIFYDLIRRTFLAPARASPLSTGLLLQNSTIKKASEATKSCCCMLCYKCLISRKIKRSFKRTRGDEH